MRDLLTLPEAPSILAATLPTGTLTFLFTDIESSTRLWEQHPNEMRRVMAQHDALIESIVAEQGGVVVRPRGEGDSRFAVFQLATGAVQAASEIQHRFFEEEWEIPSTLRVRIGLHTGEADVRDGDYYGTEVNRCARLRNIAYGGQTLLSQTTYTLVRESLPDGIGVRDLGEYKLKDIERPERIFQLIGSHDSEDFPALHTQESVSSNIPSTLTSFVGRERELNEIKELITGRRLVTVSGLGGTGKTRLAIEAARDLSDSFPDGIWFIDLSPLGNSAHLESYFLNTLGVREEANVPPAKTLVDSVHNKVLLLVLDNCEHILQEIAYLVEIILHNTQKVTILATSRAPLGVAGETVWFIPPLTTPALHRQSTLEELEQSEAVSLFVERALSARTNFTVTEENVREIAEICIQLDGIPLAIELAAARVRVLSVTEIKERLSDRFRLLVSNQNTPQRQKTLRNVIDWSHDLLPEKERILFRRLSVFTGGWALPYAEQVCSGDFFDPPEVLDLLSDLVDKSLVVVDQAGGSERFYYLETVRQYAQDRLHESDEEEIIHTRHAETYANLAEKACRELWGPGQGLWLEKLDLEEDNLRAAIEWMVSRQDFNEILLRMTVSLWRYWEIRGLLSEGRARLEHALEHASDAPRKLRANALRGVGRLALQQGDYFHAAELHQQSLALFQDLADQIGVARELNALGEIAKYQGDYIRSIDLHSQSLAIRHETGDKEGMAESLGHLGMIARERGKYQHATELLRESLDLSREIGDKLRAATALRNLGLVALVQSDYPQATELLEEAASLFQELNDRVGISETCELLGNVAKDRGNFQEAQAFYWECLDLKKKSGDSRGIAQAISSLAEVAFYQGNYPQVVEQAEQGLNIFQALGVKRGVIFCLGLLAYTAHFQGDYARAESVARTLIELAVEVGAPRPVAYANEVLGMCAYMRRDFDVAETLLEEAYRIFESLNDRRNIANLWVNMARTAYRKGNRERATYYLKESLRESRELGIRWTQSFALEILGLLEREAGNYRQANRFFLESLHLAVEQANQQGIANGLGALAGMAVLRKQPAKAACLFAAAEKLRITMGAQMGESDRQEYERYLEKLHQQIDTDALEAAWDRGRQMTIEEIVERLEKERTPISTPST